MNKISKPRRVIITHVHHNDATYHNRRKIIGMTGLFTITSVGRDGSEPGYTAGDMEFDDRFYNGCSFFYAIRYKRIPDEQPSMD